MTSLTRRSRIRAIRPTSPARAATRRLTPPELIDSVVTEEGAYLAEEIRALVDRTPFLREGYALLRTD